MFVGIVIPVIDVLQTISFSHMLGDRYEVRPIELSNEIPNNINVLILTGIKDSLDGNKFKHLKNFIDDGGNMFVALNPLSVDLQTQRAEAYKSNIFDIISPFGFTLTENLVLDKSLSLIHI